MNLLKVSSKDKGKNLTRIGHKTGGNDQEEKRPDGAGPSLGGGK